MKQYCLGDLISIKHGYAFDGEHIIQEDNGIVLVTPGNFKIGGGFKEDKCKFFDGSIPSEFLFHGGEFIVTMTDLSKEIDTLGYSARIPTCSERKYLHNQRIGLVTFKNEDCDPNYIYYLMQSREYQRSIANTSTGATVHHTSPSKIQAFRFSAPGVEEQIKIADVLTNYDLLIENYQKQIILLEESLNRLFIEWFVEFRFPDKETRPFKDGLPLGWEKKKVSELGNYLNGFAFKPSDWQKEGAPIIKIKEMGNGISKDTPRNKGDRVPAKYKVVPGDILFSWSATLMVVVWAGEEGWLNQHLFKVTPNPGIGREYLLQALSQTIEEFSNLTTGSTMKHIQRNKLDQVYVNVPDRELMNLFSESAEQMRDRIINLNSQKQLLIEARSLLLDNYFSGISSI